MESGVSHLAVLKDYRAARTSSEQREGNGDYRRLELNQTLVLADLRGPGEITHLWMTINSHDPHHLRNLVLRIYWDGNPFPSVESPVGDFFGLGHNRVYVFSNPVQAIGTYKGMNAFWPMPFKRSARVEITNEGDAVTPSLYYYVDWRRLPRFPHDAAYFHAQYRQAFPCPDGEPYRILETIGAPGHYVGVNLSVHTQVDGWWGEGDDIFTVDGEIRPSLWGTGSEDYFCGAWCFTETFYNDYFGMPYRERQDQNADNYWNVYRLHLENPVTFRTSLTVEIEHGASGFDNTRKSGHNNDYASVAYWYMKKPVHLLGTLPPASERTPVYRPLAVPAHLFEFQRFKWEMAPAGGIGVDTQDLGEFHRQSGDRWFYGDHLFCHPNEKNSIATGTLTLDKAMEGPLVFRVTQAKDYGRIRIRLDGEVVVPDCNLYHPSVRAVMLHAGDVSLDAGPHTVTVETLGKDERSKGYLWGIDYLRVGGTEAPDFEPDTPVVSGKTEL